MDSCSVLNYTEFYQNQKGQAPGDISSARQTVTVVGYGIPRPHLIFINLGWYLELSAVLSLSR
jgi:hypothetical protein